jgi:hypothetical protein
MTYKPVPPCPQEWHVWEDDGLVVQVGCVDGRFASTTKLDRRPLPSVVHIASVKQEIMEQATIAIQSTFGRYRADLYIFGQEIGGNPPPAPPPSTPGVVPSGGDASRTPERAALHVARVPEPQPLVMGRGPTARTTSFATAARQNAGCFVDNDARENLGKHRVVCGFWWLLRVIDHEAALMDPKLFSNWVHR